MFSVVVMPFCDFLAGEGDDFEMGGELSETIQQALSEELGQPVSWAESSREGEPVEAEELDEEAVWSIRVAAAWLELHPNLEGCDPGDTPWEHSVLDEVAARGGAKRFRQILHTDVDAICYAPVELDDVTFVTIGAEEEAGEAGEGQGAEEPDPADEEEYGLGSLPALIDELDALREPFGLPEKLEDIAVEEFMDDPDLPFSGAKFAWFVLRDTARVAVREKVPLMLLWGELEEQEE